MKSPTPLKNTMIQGWGRFRGIQAPVFYPSDLNSERKNLPSQPKTYRGRGRSYGDASLPAAGHTCINTQFLDKFIAFDRKTGLLTAEPGVTLEKILQVIIPAGWFLPVTPGTMQASLGGAVASNVHGKNHHQVGSIENFIREVEVILPDGTLKRCSRETFPELFNTTVGGYGLTGLISRVSIQLQPLETGYINETRFTASSLEKLLQLFEEYDKYYPYSVAWMDTSAGGKAMGRGVLICGRHAAITELAPEASNNPLRTVWPRRLNVPVNFPSGVLNYHTLKLMNTVYFHKQKSENGLVPLVPFFYPLDGVRNWNRVYGKRGFLQYQMSLPEKSGDTSLEACLQFIAHSKLGSFITVLKRCGNDNVALPFCQKGFTLALDIPYHAADTLKKLDELDELVIKHSGRVYLTKDARLSPAAFRAMYPEYREWISQVYKFNPERIISSSLAERLELWKL